MIRWSIEIIQLDLKYTWKISRNATDFKKNIIVTVTDGNISGKGEGAPNVRYGAVSYTHLDVYKRQIQNRMIKSNLKSISLKQQVRM